MIRILMRNAAQPGSRRACDAGNHPLNRSRCGMRPKALHFVPGPWAQLQRAGWLKRQGAQSNSGKYEDPKFYGKAGFEPLPENVLQSPMALSMPFGWLGKSMTGEPIQKRHDRPSCVEAFRNPAYW